MKNIDKKVVEDFGEEWDRFRQSNISKVDLKMAWDQYFSIFPFEKLNSNSVGFDMGCGSGRWAVFSAPRVGFLNCIDPSIKALNVAKDNLSEFNNVAFHNASVSDDILEPSSQDFGYCLGVLHHVPDTVEGLKCCNKILKHGAPFLLYLYYNFENRSLIFKTIWWFSNIIRLVISRMPSPIKKFITYLIAIFIYYPLSRLALLLEKLGIDPRHIPLSDYRNKPFTFLATDSLDRFGTRLEKRYSRKDIHKMLEEAGFENIKFSNAEPFWVCICYKSKSV